MTSHDLTALEALGVAVRQEIDAAQTYHDLAARCPNSLAKERFLHLERESRRHERILRARHEELAPGLGLVVPSSRAPLPEHGTAAACAGLRGALRLAADHEHAARDFYLDEAAATTDGAGAAMFRFLADVHAKLHMALEAEYDLVLRYPQAYDDTPTPWRAEARLRGD